jgi:hypothetical protein
MFAPFDSDTGTNAVVVDRTADRLTADLLAESPSDPSVLDGTCTRDFFDGTVPGDCRYDTTDLHDALGLPPTVRVNVTVRDDTGIRQLDGTRLAAGDAATAANDAVVARRVVLFPGDGDAGLPRERNQLLVRVW